MDPFVKAARVPDRPPRADLVAAGALAAWAVLEAVFGTGPGTTATRIGFALVVTAPLILRRRYPLAVVAIISAATLAWTLTADRPESGTMPFPSLLFSIFSVAIYARSTLWAVIGGLVPVAVMAAALNSAYNSGTPTPGNMAILVFFCACAWTAGWLIRRRAGQLRHAYRVSGELARSAVAEERARIARELHDIVAHGLSIISVQAGAAQQLVDKDPAAAREHLEAVHRIAKEAMTEMRRLLDVLREDDASYAPQPGLARLPELVEEARAAGVPVEVIADSDPRDLPAGVDLVAYRVVQESLTNVRKHAPGAATRIALDYEPRRISIEVSNEAGAQGVASNGGGHGLVGMAERVRIFGGELETGERPGGGFQVRVRLPLEVPPA